MIIRKATLKDVKSIAEIFRIESSKPPYNKNRTAEKALHRIKEDFVSNDIYVAEEDNKVIGFIMVSVDSGIKTQLWINEMWIVKSYQGQGIGRKLMTEVENIYKKKGIKVFELVAHTGRGGACDFYRKLNYDVDKSMTFMQKRLK